MKNEDIYIGLGKRWLRITTGGIFTTSIKPKQLPLFIRDIKHLLKSDFIGVSEIIYEKTREYMKEHNEHKK